MKIAIILPTLRNTAPIMYVHKLVKYLIEFIEIDIYYFDDTVEIQFPCTVKQIHMHDEIDFNKYDIIHSHLYRPDKYLWLHRKKIKCKTISTIHSYIPFDLNSTYNWFVSFIYSRIWFIYLNRKNYLITLTNDLKNFYSGYLSKPQIKFIHTGYDLPDIYEPINKIDLDLINIFKIRYTLIGAIANLTKQKGINQLIDAIAKDESFALLIIGDGKLKTELQKQAQLNNCLDRCIFLGYRIDAFRYLKYIDIYAMASYMEGFGIVVLEAALYKKPVLCSNIPVFRELFDKDTVAFFELNNPESILLNLKELRLNYSQYSNNIFRIVKEKYSTKRMADEYLSFYEDILKKDG